MGNSSSTTVLPLESNFLVPNGTFLVSLLAFAILIFIFGKYIIPPINNAMTSRQEAIRREFAELEEAQTDARKAEADYKEQLNDAKHEAARIREEAREQGAQIVQEAREKAQSEADRVIEHAHTQIEADRTRVAAT
jgi:F-type H+-transporting ATPase subunit b